jgi:hypothetical protein
MGYRKASIEIIVARSQQNFLPVFGTIGPNKKISILKLFFVRLKWVIKTENPSIRKSIM